MKSSLAEINAVSDYQKRNVSNIDSRESAPQARRKFWCFLNKKAYKIPRSTKVTVPLYDGGGGGVWAKS